MDSGKNNNNVVRFSGERLNFINMINQNVLRNQQAINRGQTKEEKILPNSRIISKEDPNMVIYEYPDIKFSKNVSDNCKVLFLFGEKKDIFINTFINTFRDITFEDKFRYKIKFPKSNDIFQIYDIKARSFKYNLKIICFPDFIHNKKDFMKYETMLELIDLFNKNKIPNRINYIFITFDESKKLDNNEITFFYLFMNLFSKEKVKDKIIVLYSCNKFNENQQQNMKILNSLFNYEKDDFLFEENYDSYFSSLFNPEFYYINNNILYDKNNKSEEWKKLIEQMKIIQKKISDSKSEEIDMNKKDIINNIMTSKDINIITQILNELKKYDKKELIILLFFLIYSNIKNDLTKYIIFLYDKINEPKKVCTYEINFFKGDKYFKRNLILYSKLFFPSIDKINFSKCDLNDIDFKSIQNIFTSKISLLNLSHNIFSDVSILSKEAFGSIQNMDLSYNKISNINVFSLYKCNNLKTLNLSNNDIIDINALSNADSSNFTKLEYLNISNNKIKKLNKINIKSIKTIDLLNNNLSEGLTDFINDNCFKNTLVVIENKKDILNFSYSGSCIINFKYLIEEKNKNNLLDKLSFKGIKTLILKNFEFFEFLNNESLNELKLLNLYDSKVEDITILNKIKFTNVDKIDLGNNQVIKGYNSLYTFKSIKANSIEVYSFLSRQYFCKFIFVNPNITINYIFDDLNFLKDKLLNEDMNINIAPYIFENNPNFFSFSEFKNSFKIFKKFRAYKLSIYYNSSEKKFKCLCESNNKDIKPLFIVNDLLFLKDDIFNDINSISIYNGILNDNLDLKRFTKLEKIVLKNNIIDGIKIFNDIDYFKKQNSSTLTLEVNSNICNNNLIGLLVGKFNLNNIDTKDNQIRLIYTEPFIFEVLIDKNKLNEIKSFSQCLTINLENIVLSSGDLNFLKDCSLFYLRELYLNLDENINYEFLDKIGSQSLYKVSIKNKSSQNILNYLNNNGFYCDDIDIKISKEDINYYMIKLIYKKKFYLYFNYLYEINKNLDILKNINLNIYKLNLSNLNIKNIDFLSNRTLYSLRILDLDSNKIEDISIFTTEKISFKLYRLCLKNNPIKIGINVLKNEFFKRSIYMELSIIKNNNEYKISSNYRFPFYDIEFYVNSINEIVNIFDFKNSFIKLNKNNLEEEKIVENIIRTNESVDNRTTILEIILFILKFKNNNYSNDTINIIYDNNKTEFGQYNNIYINDTNRALIEKAFVYILEKKPNYEEIYYKFSYINMHNLNSSHENIIINFPFKKIYNLSLINCNFDLSILQKTKLNYLTKIDLSQSKVTDISGICDNVPFNNLKILNLSQNGSISNLYELKRAIFKDLEELYLSNDNIKDLDEIKFGEYGFYKLKILDLSHNLIQSLSPLRFYRNLKILNLEYNLINNEDEYKYVIDLNQYIQIRTLGNAASGVTEGVFCMKI